MNVTEGVDASRSGVLYHCEASNMLGARGNGSPAVLRSRDVNVTYTCESL